ncbi:MAG: 23S rRNA pseudouridine(955/2504/2580) synthase RluC [Candidatus Thiodiazotropha lotti]|uniref:Pseudouridine synthase n=1 Tax=Candidatus Thiodiazotropha endoloripes TaxID=1818881 RepID=A0A1E2USL7_9GAMM|nr:23S rRNA pseudouridine(955/2504/2580) synthase RluC [Candidatus Thiodiazotropha endoloripes]MCG7897621.1 23S rRNA pseudouridine(955/2504/2580) synthase RluC [Candidatus Thiodiazotropha weberae]MCG7990600.1 23S rRNA pseudouridine(955/2504/2580) synthase RluC [Candidatus Thiodiazotropha lotti]MCG7901544.1 23S rRNA pseudouridine(955/2504/2580) synthase RluC [Candidatus Thiodiazotropha weberae]MCG7915748.1 23S rRNA pseudouridine(955/2504/2580) synthase RluC [Candidatus Thiodiazotropha weberae]M
MSESTKNSSTVRFIDITQEEAGQRIDNYLMRQLKGAPKSYIYRILRKGEVRVNKGRVKAHYKLNRGDSIRLPPMRLSTKPDQRGRISENLMDLLRNSVVYEDERILVVNKPSGLAVHGGSGVNFGVIEVLRQLRPEDRHLELVHRLDRDTSGCLLISKKRSALRTLHELIRENRIDKRYLALLHGSWRKGVQTVDMPLKKNTLQGGERVVRVDAEGKPSQTIFRRIERFTEATLVEAELITGRTHQIRVHSQWLGSPVLGDQKYGDAAANRAFREKGLKRLFLHAFKLGLRWPGEKRQLVIEAPLPDALSQVLARLKG